MSNLTRCKNCNGEMVYKPDTGMINCERCGSPAPVTEGNGKPVKRMYSPTYVPDENKMVSQQYTCTSCGAKIVAGTDNDIKRCASCGNTSLKKETITTVVPDGIIPFTVSRNKAVQLFRDWVGSRKFAPSDLKQMAKLEKIIGLYTPIWKFDFTATCRYTAVGVKKRTDSDGHVEFFEYPVDKTKDTKYADQIMSGSSRISDTFISELGDYDFSKLRPYSTDYLLGFAGIDTDVDVHNVYNNMTSSISSTNERKALSNLEDDYFRVNNFNCRTRFRDVTFNYSYVPVWANHYTYKGKEYHCYINGQTGKTTGKAPKSFLKIASLVGGIVGALALAVIIILAFI